MDFDVLIGFFRESLDSVNEGSSDFTLAIANSVVWGCALDEALAENLGGGYTMTRDDHFQGRALGGLRLARNAILHGQTFALQRIGRAYPSDEDPMFYGTPLWKSYDELTRDWTPQNRGAGLARLRDAYERDVAGRTIGAPLWDAREWLDGVAERGWGL